MKPHKILFVVNVDWFFVSHRLPIAKAAREQGYEVHVATFLTDRKEELERCGLIVHALPEHRGQNSLPSVMGLFLRICRVYASVRPDLVHLVTIKSVLMGGIAARLLGVKSLVAAVSGLGFVFIARGKLAELRRRLVGYAYRLALSHPRSRVIFQNPDDLLAVSRMAGLQKSQTRIVRGSGVGLDQFAFSPMPEGRPVVLLAARLLVDKGVYEFIDAARQVLRDTPAGFPVPRFVLVGAPDADNPSSLTPQDVEKLRLEGDVEFWGHRQDMASVIASASIVVLPSYREGLPKVLVEAAACGRAVITTDVPGCRDAIDPGTTGLLVPPKDSRALAQAIRTLLADPKKCAEMGVAARALAERAFDIRSIVRQHLQIYQELLPDARA